MLQGKAQSRELINSVAPPFLLDFQDFGFEIHGFGATFDELGFDPAFVVRFEEGGIADASHFQGAFFGQELVLLHQKVPK
jgi:hypothetical protein